LCCRGVSHGPADVCRSWLWRAKRQQQQQQQHNLLFMTMMNRKREKKPAAYRKTRGELEIGQEEEEEGGSRRRGPQARRWLFMVAVVVVVGWLAGWLGWAGLHEDPNEEANAPRGAPAQLTSGSGCSCAHSPPRAATTTTHQQSSAPSIPSVSPSMQRKERRSAHHPSPPLGKGLVPIHLLTHSGPSSTTRVVSVLLDL